MWNPGDSGQAAVKANQWHDIIQDTNYSRKHTGRETFTQQTWTAKDFTSVSTELSPFTSRLKGREQLLQQNHLWPGERTVLKGSATAVLMYWAKGEREVHGLTNRLPEHTMALLGQVLLLEPQAGMESGVCSKGESRLHLCL